jgi:hypothetical protein
MIILFLAADSAFIHPLLVVRTERKARDGFRSVRLAHKAKCLACKPSDFIHLIAGVAHSHRQVWGDACWWLGPGARCSVP